jgi:hypothetical protein
VSEYRLNSYVDMENDIAAAEAKDSSDDEDDTENLLAITEFEYQNCRHF